MTGSPAYRAEIVTTISGHRRVIVMRVYQDLAHMRAACTRWTRRVSPHDSDWSDTVGVCHSYQRVSVRPDGTEAEDDEVCTIRLTRGHMQSHIVVHELTHAAQHIYDLDSATADAEHGEHEALAWIVGELVYGAQALRLLPADTPR